ncbi:MAG TPA: CbiX/SirB N-terminal domain-containing protein [Gemmatimonadaceae bacterium]|nr:CbiX/SirB N-terminal domain-containing protein [Gemmatimonadaceae bacterium]
MPPMQKHLSALAALTLVLAATAASAQTVQSISVGERTVRTVGTIVVAHGGDSAWNAGVLDAARSARTGGPVEVSFLMGPAAKEFRFQDAVANLERRGATEIVVVPMLVSSHSGHYDQVRYLAGDSVTLDEQMLHHLHMAGLDRASTTLPLRVTKALDDAPQLARVITQRALALTKSPRERAVLIVGHGPNSAEDYAAWMANLRPVADSVAASGHFRDVRVELVRDDAPAAVRAEAVRRTRDIIQLQYAATGKDVIVVPVLVSKGAISRDKIPSDLAGLPIVYSGEPLLPHPEIARWIESRVSASR